jgi:peptidoglycan/LPS O-acetylase OafA/YrhL
MIYALEGLRGIAAILVALYHSWPTNIRAFPLISNGWLWVDLFFVLSGCVMAHAYDGKITSIMKLKAFFVKRLGRLYPLHLVTTVAYMVILAALPFIALAAKKLIGVDQSPLFSDSTLFNASVWQNIAMQLPFHLTLTHGLNTVEDLTLNLPSWSISTEFAVYCLFALLWFMFSKAKNFQFPVTLSLCVGSLGYLLFYGGRLNLGYMNDLGFWRCLAGFSIGTFIPTIWKQFDGKNGKAFASITQAIGLILSTLVFFLASEYPKLTYVAPFAFFLLVLGLGAKESALTKLFSIKPLVTLGALSYSIYLWHVPVLLVLKPVSFLLPFWAKELFVLVYLLILIYGAKLSYKFIEVPWRNKAALFAKRFSNSTHSKMNIGH